MDATHACRPNDDGSRSQQTTQDSEHFVQETITDINERKSRENNFLILNAPQNLKEEKVRIDMELVGGLYNKMCNINIDVKD